MGSHYIIRKLKTILVEYFNISNCIHFVSNNLQDVMDSNAITLIVVGNKWKLSEWILIEL